MMLKIFQAPPRELTHQKIFARIGKFLVEHGLCPSPENYSLVYQLVVDSDSAVSREVKRLVSDGIRLSQPEADRIRSEFGIGAKTAAEAEPVDDAALAAAKLLLQQFAETVEQARVETELYGRDLEQGAAALETAGPEAGLGSLIRITGAILERTRTAERRLVQAESETQTLRRQLSEMVEEARRDPLTGLANRRAFEDRCRELDLEGIQVAVAICDIDHFKLINDGHGHVVGDRVLKMMAKRLQRACAGHMVARLGGEEFVILFEGLTAVEAGDLVDKARRSLMRRDFVLRGTGERIGQVTFSAGIACCADGAVQALMRADELLYEAKNSGRNRIRVDE
ncbi:GGDEF domain-containing protein [Sphingosinicella sp. CPCC 101087]|uniref:GGDEF domain-containing protein n=1 Tax=Sphingosinicella sp. CPCC 101087 TaxID=2497754 RepID=UPI00101D3D86|nr:GGDEF domain-containing protein [Sphingosinicella sp. CPCC 101087]